MVEATLVMPLSILVTVALILLMVEFFGVFRTQISTHNTARQSLYEKKETQVIRLKDKVLEIGETAMEGRP